nr:MAG TPA: hypothetical protein [Bacteriophage sp.]
MKELAKTFVQSVVASGAAVIGMLGGMWLWGNVLEDKAEKLKDRFNNKPEEEES